MRENNGQSSEATIALVSVWEYGDFDKLGISKTAGLSRFRADEHGGSCARWGHGVKKAAQPRISDGGVAFRNST
jgi:hypothetical protein